MLRTRDFILVFVTVVFLVLAIGTAWLSPESSSEISTALEFNDTTSTDFTAEMYVPVELFRAERIAQMRQKIAASDAVIKAADAESEPEEELDTVTDASNLAVLQQCSNYQEYTGTWPVQGLQIEVAEGARLVYTESAATLLPDPASTSTIAQLPIVERTILLQLAVNPFIVSNPTCIPGDVVGVAQDGSLIRNNEASLYGVFSDQTLIGYALDGHPIYGVSNRELDECGGAVFTGSYGYYLSDDRDAILNCYVSSPATIVASS